MCFEFIFWALPLQYVFGVIDSPLATDHITDYISNLCYGRMIWCAKGHKTFRWVHFWIHVYTFNNSRGLAVLKSGCLKLVPKRENLYQCLCFSSSFFIPFLIEHSGKSCLHSQNIELLGGPNCTSDSEVYHSCVPNKAEKHFKNWENFQVVVEWGTTTHRSTCAGGHWLMVPIQATRSNARGFLSTVVFLQHTPLNRSAKAENLLMCSGWGT